MTRPRRALLVALLGYLLAGGTGPLAWCGPHGWPQTVTWADGQQTTYCADLPPEPSFDAGTPP